MAAGIITSAEKRADFNISSLFSLSEDLSICCLLAVVCFYYSIGTMAFSLRG